MSQATVARKERRKRFIARLKQNCERNPACESRFDNTHACQQNSFQEIIAATQQACVASFIQGCDYAKIMYYSAFQDGFLAGNEQARTSQANMAHAPAQTVDRFDVCMQTDCADSLGLEPNQSKGPPSSAEGLPSVPSNQMQSETQVSTAAPDTDKPDTNSTCRFQTRRSTSIDLLVPQQVTADPLVLEPNESLRNGALEIGDSNRKGACSLQARDSTSIDLWMPQQVMVDPVVLEPNDSDRNGALEMCDSNRKGACSLQTRDSTSMDLSVHQQVLVDPLVLEPNDSSRNGALEVCDSNRQGACSFQTRDSASMDLRGPLCDLCFRFGARGTVDHAISPQLCNACYLSGVKTIPLVIKRYRFRRKPVQVSNLASQLRSYLNDSSEDDLEDIDSEYDSEDAPESDSSWLQAKTSLMKKYKITRIN